uniref:Type II toxin-antitoxin system RelE/ParE family toxin n=1 Tax=Heterorhabditis bacteriophora TaxID=37862 RepID=A0A1I7WB92_HETBA
MIEKINEFIVVYALDYPSKERIV